VALTLLISTVLMPSSDNGSDVFYSGTYVDILAADHAEDFSQVLPVGDVQQ